MIWCNNFSRLIAFKRDLLGWGNFKGLLRNILFRRTPDFMHAGVKVESFQIHPWGLVCLFPAVALEVCSLGCYLLARVALLMTLVMAVEPVLIKKNKWNKSFNQHVIICGNTSWWCHFDPFRFFQFFRNPVEHFRKILILYRGFNLRCFDDRTIAVGWP